MKAELKTSDQRGEHRALTLPDGRLTAGKDAPIGGQAVLEGVMMRGVSTWAVAVRRPANMNGREPSDGQGSSEGREPSEDREEVGPQGEGAAPASETATIGAVAPTGGLDGAVAAVGDGAVGAAERPDALGEIETHTESFVPWVKRRRAFRLPIVRGVVALVESLKIGFKALGMSANAQLEEEDEKISGGAWGVTIGLSLLFAIGLFFVLPVTIANFWKDELGNSVFFVVVEKLIRVSIFLGYLWALSKLPDLRRVFEYHGAEHKVISCYEAGDELVPERARLYSRLHLRCGTSFLLIVMIIAVFVFAPIGRPDLHWLILSRVLGIALVAGLAYEVIKWASRNRRKRWVRALMWPGLQLQKLTTREPSLDQLAVSIAALEAVLAVENPAASSEEDRVGMEVVA
jgi:uncharacterized protein YqhQ